MLIEFTGHTATYYKSTVGSKTNTKLNEYKGMIVSPCLGSMDNNLEISQYRVKDAHPHPTTLGGRRTRGPILARGLNHSTRP